MPIYGSGPSGLAARLTLRADALFTVRRMRSSFTTRNVILSFAYQDANPFGAMTLGGIA